MSDRGAEQLEWLRAWERKEPLRLAAHRVVVYGGGLAQEWRLWLPRKWSIEDLIDETEQEVQRQEVKAEKARANLEAFREAVGA